LVKVSGVKWPAIRVAVVEATTFGTLLWRIPRGYDTDHSKVLHGCNDTSFWGKLLPVPSQMCDIDATTFL
jgi:hypothetical protein